MTFFPLLLQTSVTSVFPSSFTGQGTDLLSTLENSIVSPGSGNVAPLPAIIWSHTFPIAHVLATFALTLRIIMAGFSIMFGQGARTFSDQFFDIIIKGMILWFFVFSGAATPLTPGTVSSTNPDGTPTIANTTTYLPIAQGWLVNAFANISTAGNEIACQLGAPANPQTGQIQGNSSNSLAMEPPYYWANYIMGLDPNNPGQQCRFSFKWVIHNIFGWDQGYAMYAQFIKWCALLSPAALVGSLSNNAPISLASSFVLAIALPAFVGIFGVGLLAFGAVVGLIFAAIFSWLGSLLAPYIVFWVVLSFGIAVFPLIFFKRFEGIWVQYSVFLTSAVLCVFFYYVASAIGYSVATKTMGAMFMPQSGTIINPDGSSSNTSTLGFFAQFWTGTTNTNSANSIYTNTMVPAPGPGLIYLINPTNSTSQFSALQLCMQLMPFYDAINQALNTNNTAALAANAVNTNSTNLYNGTSINTTNYFDAGVGLALQNIGKVFEDNSNNGIANGSFQEGTTTAINAFQVAIQAILAEGAWTAGIGILSAIIGGGILLSAIGPLLAFSWEKAFTSQEMIGKFQEFFQKVGGATQSGIRGIANTAQQRVSGMGSMVGRTAGNIVGALGRGTR